MATDANYNSHKELNLTADELHDIRSSVSVYLAADVIYDNTITVHFMNALYDLISSFDTDSKNLSKKTCFISNEKRINFSKDEMEPSDSAFRFFQECLSELDKYVDSEKAVVFAVTQLYDADLMAMPQYIKSYRRNKYLSIWKIECSKL